MAILLFVCLFVRFFFFLFIFPPIFIIPYLITGEVGKRRGSGGRIYVLVSRVGLGIVARGSG